MTEKNDEGLYAVVGTVLSWRDDTSTLLAELALEFNSEGPDGTVQEPAEVASLIEEEVSLRLVGATDKELRHGKIMSVAHKVQKEGPVISTAKVASSGALSNWAGRAVTVARMQMPLRPVKAEGDGKSRAAGE